MPILVTKSQFQFFDVLIKIGKQNFGEVKLWRIDGFRVLARENVGEFLQ